MEGAATESADVKLETVEATAEIIKNENATVKTEGGPVVHDVKLMTEVKKQIEFYFSDSNFRKDAFLRAASDTHPEGYVPIVVLLTFNKLKALSTDVALIAEAMKSSEIVTVSTDGLNIKRSAVLPEEDFSKSRTLYVKGYPTDDATINIDTIGAQFSIYGKVVMVRLRRDDNAAFKGSCFLEFEKDESVKAAVDGSHEDGIIKAEYKGTPLDCVMPLVEWLQNRANKRQKQNKDRKPSTAGDKEGGEQASKKRKLEEVEQKANKGQKVEFTPGLIILVKNIPAESTMFDVKDLLKKIGDIKYVELKDGETEAFVRVADITTAELVMQAIEKGLPVIEGGANITGTVLAGEEELAYWTKIEAESKRKNAGGRGGGRGGGGRGRGGRGGRGGGRGGRGRH